MGDEESFGRNLQQCCVTLFFTFVCCVGYSALNDISMEMENPFGDDDNDFPLNVQQWHIVWATEDIYFAKTPQDYVATYEKEAMKKAEARMRREERKRRQLEEARMRREERKR